VSNWTLFSDDQSESLAPSASGIVFGAASRQCKRTVFMDLLIDDVLDEDDSPPKLLLSVVGSEGPMPRGRNGGGGKPPTGSGGGGGGGPPGIIGGGGGGGGGGGPLPMPIGGAGGGPVRSAPIAIMVVSSSSFNSSKLRSCTRNLRAKTLPTIYSHWRSLSDKGFDNNVSGNGVGRVKVVDEICGDLLVAACKPTIWSFLFYSVEYNH
jgi:hypothetical protein